MTHLISFRKRECRESNQGPLGEKRKCYHCAVPATLEVKDLILFTSFFVSLDSSRWSEEEFSPSPAAFTWMKKKERKERKNSICSSQKVKTEKVVFLVFGGKKVFLCWYSGHVPCCDLALGSETRREKRRSVAPQILPRCCCSSSFVPGMLFF